MSYLYDWLGKRALISPHRLALIDAETMVHYSFEELNARANQTANYLIEQLDVCAGDRVAVLAHNCVEYLDILFACNKIGAVIQNLNWRLAPRELAHLIKASQPKALIYSKELIANVDELKKIPSLYPSYYVALSDKSHSSDFDFSDSIEYSDVAPVLPNLSWEAPWILCYTGGTTGRPKGVMITLRQMSTNTANTLSCGVISSSDMGLTNMPLFHTSGINCFLAPLVHVGGASVLCKSFNADQVFDLIERLPITILMSAPTGFIQMQQNERWEEADLTKLRYVVSGGAPCPAPVSRKFFEKNPHFAVGYGLTEVGPSNFFLPFCEQKKKLGSIGYPLMLVDSKLIDENDCEITEPGKSGELLLRGKHCTPAYWDNHEASKRLIDDDGWVHTGDLAHFDKDGAYWILGRKTDMYISGGENIYPMEVESVLSGHDAILEVVVFGVEDDYWGEVGCAIIYAKPGSHLNDEMLTQFLEENIARYKIPKYFIFVEEPLPKTEAGKLDLRKLKQLYDVECCA